MLRVHTAEIRKFPLKLYGQLFKMHFQLPLNHRSHLNTHRPKNFMNFPFYCFFLEEKPTKIKDQIHKVLLGLIFELFFVFNIIFFSVSCVVKYNRTLVISILYL